MIGDQNWIKSKQQSHSSAKLYIIPPLLLLLKGSETSFFGKVIDEQNSS